MPPATPERSKRQILVVDDEPQILTALDDLLSDDFVVFKAETGQQALRVIDQEPSLAVLLSDQRMPRMSGDELLAQLPQTCMAARILISGYADLNAVIRAVNEGRLFAYVSKPWHPDDLRLKVTQAAEHSRLARQLSEEQQLLRDVIGNMPDGIYFKDLDLKFQRANPAYAALNGTAPSGILNRRLKELPLPPADAEEIERQERALMTYAATSSDVVRKSTAATGERWLSESKAPVRNSVGTVIGLVGVVRDITERRAEEERLLQMSRLRAAASAINATLQHASDPDQLVAEVCRLLVVLGELKAGAVLSAGEHPAKLELAYAKSGDTRVPSALAEYAREWWRSYDERLDLPASGVEPCAEHQPSPALTAAGVRSVYTVGLQPLTRGVVLALCSTQADFFTGERRSLLEETLSGVSLALDHIRKSRQLEFLAHNDALTGLPNLRRLMERIDQQLVLHEKSGRKLALILVDLARFRMLNDALGRTAADQLLVAVAHRLLAIEVPSTVARFDGNVFALLCTALESEAAVAQLVDTHLARAFDDPFVVAGKEVRLSFAAGVALVPSDADRSDVLVGKAEVALKKAKATLRSHVFYAPELNARYAEQVTLESKLRRALRADEFILFYQPKIDLGSGRVIGLEALIRWRDPDVGLVSPAAFIPVLEETGLIREVGQWALGRAAAQFRAWLQAGLAPPPIAVNVSAVQLAAPDFSARLEHALRPYPDAAGGVELEITESVFVEDLEGSIKKLEAAIALGLKVAIDDFGTGYSSLSYLSRLPVHKLKIDRSFVARMVDDAEGTAIVMAIISLAHTLELTTIAEGVETPEQAQLLRSLGCDEVQGYLFAKPMPAEQVASLFTSSFALSA